MFLSNGSVTATQIASLADTSPMFASASYYSESQLQLSGRWAAYGQIYRSQLWVGTVVRKLAMATGFIPFDVMLNGAGNDRTHEAGILAELMERPNEKLSGFALWRWTSATYDVYGEAFWLKLRDGKGRVRELHPIHPTNLVLRRNDEGDLEYVYTAGSRAGYGMQPIAFDDVVAFTSFNPDNMSRGLSTLEGLRMTLLNEDASRRANASFWRRGARPSVILSHPKALGDNAYERLKADFDKNHQGADNFGGTNILEEGMTVTTIQLTAEEMQYIESRKLAREEVCAAYDVPPPVVHILDHATFSNITEQLRSQYRDTMAPRFTFFESVINHQLLPDFYSWGDAFTRFSMDEVLRGDFETRAEAVGKLITAGVMKPSEARPLFNLPDGGAAADQLFGNAALVPLGSNVRPAQPIATDGTVMPQALEPKQLGAVPSTKALTVRSIMGSLSQVKADKPAMKAKLVKAHTKELAAFFDEQRASVKAALGKKDAGVFTASDWDDQLAGILSTLSTATTQAIGAKTATDLGGSYDGSSIADWLTTDAKDSAANINARTKVQIDESFGSQDELDFDPEDWADELFDGPIGARADEISLSRVTMLAGFAALLAAEQSDAMTKTWVTTSPNPRPSHAAMDGEQVGLGQVFSNGMNGPGDFTGGADEVAGCTCDLVFGF